MCVCVCDGGGEGGEGIYISWENCRKFEKMQCTLYKVISVKLGFQYGIFLSSIYVAFPHMFSFSHTCVVKSTYYTGSSCVALTTQVCFIAHTCGNNQACVVGFFPHMFGKTPT